MDRGDLTLAVAGALLRRCCWAGSSPGSPAKLNVRRGAGGPMSELVAQLGTEEAARRQAEARLSEVETELASVRRQLDQARDQAEEVRAAYRAAMQRGDV